MVYLFLVVVSKVISVSGELNCGVDFFDCGLKSVFLLAVILKMFS